MKNILKLEELIMFIGSIYFYSTLSYPWWMFLVLILLPDISMLGYLINTKIGAISYNIFHHKGLAILTILHGIYWSQPIFVLAGTILFAHSSMDRILGYGLKYTDHFKHTHLGMIGQENK